MAAYEDFWWYIHPRLSEAGYYQQIDRAPTGYIPDDIRVWNLEQLLNDSVALRAALEDPEATVDLVELQTFGDKLLQCLVSSYTEVARIYQDAVSAVESKPLRLTLELIGPELINFPWEYLYDPGKGKYLALLPSLSLVRGLRGPLGRAPDPLDIPLRMLVVIASPGGVDGIEVAEERALLEAALKQPLEEGLVEIEWLLRASRDMFSERIAAQGLGNAPPLHIIHFICHGLPGSAEGQGQILLEGPQREREPVPALELAQWLGALPSLRLVVLNSCLTARTNNVSEFSGVAQALVGAGVPAVIGMQHEIPMNVAKTFAETFYGTLFAQFIKERREGAFEGAFASARLKISSKYGLSNPCWGTPVLYVRARMGDPFPLVPLPPNVTAAQREQINALSQQLAYFRGNLQRVLGTYGDPLPASAPAWIQEEAAQLQNTIAAVRVELQQLGVA